MKTTANNNSGIIVAFHTGRGGRFNNAGHTTFIGEKKIGEFTDDLFTTFQNISQFENRYGYDSCEDDQRCIINLIHDGDFDELEEKFGITEEMLGEEIYLTCSGNEVGLTQKEVELGVGSINMDNDYDSTSSMFIEDCDEESMRMIINSDNYKSLELRDYINENWAELVAEINE